MSSAIIRIIVIGSLLLLGIFAFIMGILSRPHKLKKAYFKVIFKKDGWSGYPGSMLNTIYARKTGDRIAAIVWLVIASFVVYLLITAYHGEYILFLVSSLFGVLYNLYLTTRRIIIYDNAIEDKNIIKSKLFKYNEIDCIETYNIVNSFNRGKSFGYQIIQNKVIACRFDNRHYIKLDALETILTKDNQQIDDVER
jgi:hypothetical protein